MLQIEVLTVDIVEEVLVVKYGTKKDVAAQFKPGCCTLHLPDRFRTSATANCRTTITSTFSNNICFRWFVVQRVPKLMYDRLDQYANVGSICDRMRRKQFLYQEINNLIDATTSQQLLQGANTPESDGYFFFSRAVGLSRRLISCGWKHHL